MQFRLFFISPLCDLVEKNERGVISLWETFSRVWSRVLVLCFYTLISDWSWSTLPASLTWWLGKKKKKIVEYRVAFPGENKLCHQGKVTSRPPEDLELGRDMTTQRSYRLTRIALKGQPRRPPHCSSTIGCFQSHSLWEREGSEASESRWMGGLHYQKTALHWGWQLAILSERLGPLKAVKIWSLKLFRLL